MNRSLDDLSASELNAAIDDTNFPKIQNAVVYGALVPLSTDDAVATTKNGMAEDDQTSTVANISNESAVLPSTHSNGIGDGSSSSIMKRAHPAPLKMVSFKSDSFDVPGTPRTPRTSTTPGNDNKNERLIAFSAMSRIHRTQKSIIMIECEIDSKSEIASEHLLLPNRHKNLMKTIRRLPKLSTIAIRITRWKLCLSVDARARQ